MPGSESSIGSQNWSEVFSYVFHPMSELDVKDFLDKFGDINIRVGHNKEGAITSEQQTRIFDYIQRSQELIRKLNVAYQTLFRSLYRGQTIGELYFSFCKFKDKDGLKPIFVDRQTAERLCDLLSLKDRLDIDLEDWHHLEQYYGISYRVFVAFLSRLVNQTKEDEVHSLIHATVIASKGCIISVTLDKLQRIKTKDGQFRFIPVRQLSEYLTTS